MIAKQAPCVVMLSYWVTEESGGPGIAAAGFASGLAQIGVEVVLIARENLKGRWLVDETSAQRDGYRLVKVPAMAFPLQLRTMTSAVAALHLHDRPSVIWVNGIWGVQSLAAYLASGNKIPYVIRPAGSLGNAALARKALKKKLYWSTIESRIVKRARALHCLSKKEVEELEESLRSRAFVVPSGVEMPSGSAPPRESKLVGVLARLHPIKNHQFALDALERLVSLGFDFRLEFAGSTSDSRYEALLRERVRATPSLATRVAFLGHVEKAMLPQVVGRWRAAMLLSDQENFGHAVIAAAALGVPTVVSPGVGLGVALQGAGAGLVANPRDVPQALLKLMGSDKTAACQDFARRYSWRQVSMDLAERLGGIAHNLGTELDLPASSFMERW